MAALTANRRTADMKLLDPEHGHKVDFQMEATTVIYEGGFVGDNGSGFAQALAAGDPFWGVAVEKKTGGSAAGDVLVKVHTGAIMEHALASTTVADIGKSAYASDDQTLTLTQASNSLVGRIIDVPTDGTVLVQNMLPSLDQYVVALTDSSGGTANDTLEAIGATYDQAEVRNNFADLAAKVNEIIAAL